MTQGFGTSQARGLRAHWQTLLAMCEQSPLVELGIVDFDVLATSESPLHMRSRDAFFDATINCVMFLRNQARATADVA